MGYTSADILFDPETHTSRLPDGRSVPHVTGILGAVGVSTNFEDLAGISPRVDAAIRNAAARGSAAHADCHAYDDNDLDWATVDPRVRPYVEAWVACRDAMGFVALAHARERRIYHSARGYTGILDGIFTRVATGKTLLIDLKTGDPESSACHLQTAAYMDAWLLEHPDIPIDERWAVWLRPERVIPYTIINYSARPDHWFDSERFACCVTTYNEQPERRGRVSRVA